MTPTELRNADTGIWWMFQEAEHKVVMMKYDEQACVQTVWKEDSLVLETRNKPLQCSRVIGTLAPRIVNLLETVEAESPETFDLNGTSEEAGHTECVVERTTSTCAVELCG